jgi:phage gp46-like protein
MTDQFDGDVALVLGFDGGNIHYSGGQPVMDAGGLETAVNISLFTGLGWWGNDLFRNEPDRQIGADFEETVRPKVITNAYLRSVEDAALSALQWMLNINAAKSVSVAATWPELNKVNITILITKLDDDIVNLKYNLNWESGYLFPVTANIGA